MTNLLLADWETPFQIAPFDQISDDDFSPALETALAQHRAQIEAITNTPAPASFDNVIAALEAAGQNLARLLGVFYTLAGAHSTPAREALQREFSPKLAAHYADITANSALFVRISQVWQARDQMDLSPEQARVLMLTHRDFVRAGAALSGPDAARIKVIKERLAALGTRFAQNLLADEAEWTLELPKEDQAGLPAFVIDAARAAGRERQAAHPIITLSRSSVTPFLQFSPRRDLREIACKASGARGANGNAHDNRAIAAQMLELRAEMANMLGYENYAAYRLETEMAGTPQAVHDLLMQVWAPAKAAADQDAIELQSMLRADGYDDDLRPWDWHYYSEKRRRAIYDLDEAEIKAYFKLEQMIEAAFDCAHRLFGLEFRALDIPLYHADCRAWEVTRNGQHLAVFIGDYFARTAKRSGAWCSAMRGQSRYPSKQSPVVLNVCNFARGEPALLSYDDARTLFHEFGHALHQILSDVTYESISGTSVARDFVELPSQLFEHWLTVPQLLTQHARHTDTGAPMPQALLDKILAAQNYDMGFQTVEYVASALVDLAFHSGPAAKDPMARQAGILADIAMPDAIGMRHATPHFAHVFAGDGYASAYYSYMWSEVMDADAFAAFDETGDPFAPDIARMLETHILSKGGCDDPAKLYTQFRGRLPGVEALLKGRGFAVRDLTENT